MPLDLDGLRSLDLTPRLGEGGRFVVMSDCHRGDGSGGDEFARNSLVYKCALAHYLEAGFTYVELGDAEELWENDSFDQIYITHTSVYDLLGRFHDPDPAKTRYIKVFGNHDEDWRDDPGPLRDLFPGIEVHEAVTLGPFVLLHGHQCDPACTGLGARISRYLVRHLWSGLQRFGIGDPTRAAENPGRCDEIDAALHGAARRSGKIVVAGHTHRPVFANLSLTERRFLETGRATPGIRRKEGAEAVYFNAGSCVHPRSVTGIEIVFTGAAACRLTLVKWGPVAGAEVCTADGCRSYPLAVNRTPLEEIQIGDPATPSRPGNQ
ncbi:MAG TPA: hypothetical protein PLW40_08510 [Syntrophales bacterium]|nr:hypothetical protein [Syntrophales bacterium]HOM07716.1 hypothetical protein [Syntrophales bacterium]HPQ07240.1 hypothetical protein [Syntrophales bacterium]